LENLKEMNPNLVICICTYQRAHLLSLLLDDLHLQTCQPAAWIIVDGDPSSGETRRMLAGRTWRQPCHYLPSNHANLAYQRYLGWRAASKLGAGALLYLDDDLRVRNPAALASLVTALQDDDGVAGVGTDTSRNIPGKLTSQPVLLINDAAPGLFQGLVRRLGSGRAVPPGGLTPAGQRRFPMVSANGFSGVQWLQGRVMLYRMSAVSHDCFSEDLFALDHIRCDLGEDTFLSRQIGARGRLLLGFGLGFEHPNADLPSCYPIEARRFGYARAYSRRFLNDHYRVSAPPRLGDRLGLFQSYLGNTLINLWRAAAGGQAYQRAYALGYAQGALRGIFQKPTARRLTPQINWWADAEAALGGLDEVSP
jgi:glycosyltransferase involved in cell wall biosynthesis